MDRLFSTESGTPVVLTSLLARAIAAVLHLAKGSISVAATTAADAKLASIAVSRSQR